MRTDVHEIEAAGDDLKNPKRHKQTADLSKAAIGVDAAQDGRKDRDQHIRLGNVCARGIEAAIMMTAASQHRTLETR